jgi:cell division protein FtsQ
MKECEAELLAIKGKREQLKKRQQVVEQRKHKLYKRKAEFAKLIEFVADVGEDPFWSVEVVQFVADTTSMGDISLRLVPRSGDFIIEFGTLEKAKEKLAKLHDFYDDGLSHIGWDEFRCIDVRYDKQVICTK